jgi:hypothetical protein
MKAITEKIKFRYVQFDKKLSEKELIRNLHETAYKLELVKPHLRAMLLLQVSFKKEIPEYIDVYCFQPKARHIDHINDPYKYGYTAYRKLIDLKLAKINQIHEVDLQNDLDFSDSACFHIANYIEWISFRFPEKNSKIDFEFQLFKKNRFVHESVFLPSKDVKLLNHAF